MDLKRWSEKRGEPAWLTRRRIDAQERLGARAPQVNLDAPIGALAPLPPELAAQGIELRPIAQAPQEVWPALGEESVALVAEAFWTGGFYARVPPGVRAEFPLQVSAGLKSFGFVERSLLVVEQDASLEFVEGCTELSGGAGERWSLFDARCAGMLKGSSIQAWPAGTISRSLKRLQGAGVRWTDANLWAQRVEKEIRADSTDVLCGGYAKEGQEQRLKAAAVLAAGTVVADSPKVERWDGRQDLHAFFAPLARRLPLEFSVEFTRLLDAELHS